MSKYNKKIIDEFKKLVKQIQFDIDNAKNNKDLIKHSFRLQSIKKILDVLENFPDKITSSNQLKNISGIGKNSLKRIDEILKFGKLSEINENILDDKYIDYINELESIFGIGRKMALDLVYKHNIKSIKELKKVYKSGQIKLPNNVIKGLKYYNDIKENVPRHEIDLIYNLLIRELNKVDNRLFGTICGSYRRLKDFSNDIDFLIIHPKIKNIKNLNNNKFFETFLNKLFYINFMVESFTDTKVKSKFMGLCRLSKKYPIRRIDIRFIPYESYYYSLLYFTGSGDFNKQMRQVAIDNNYILNEYGLYDKKNKMFKVNSEKEIFDLLGMEFIEPQYRN